LRVEICRGPICADAMSALCRSVGWPEPDPTLFRKAIEGSIGCVHAMLGDQVVGFGRLVGDRSWYIYVQDLVVHGDHHRSGIGERLLEELHDLVRALPQSRRTVLLIADESVVGFYLNAGYESAGQRNVLMRKKLA